MKKHLIRNLFLLFSFLPFIETFANWNSFIINFDKNLYGKGAQTWQPFIVERILKSMSKRK